MIPSTHTHTHGHMLLLWTILFMLLEYLSDSHEFVSVKHACLLYVSLLFGVQVY